MFATIASHCCTGSRLVCTLSDVRLRDLLKRYGHTMHLIEDYEPAGVVLNRLVLLSIPLGLLSLIIRLYIGAKYSAQTLLEL